MRETIVVIGSHEEGKYFFSTDHCQDHGLGETYVPVSYNIGLCWHKKADIVSVMYQYMEEIPNPNQEKQG